MSTVWPRFIAFVVYGTPSVTLYFLTFYIIIKHRKTFDSSFFQLYLFDGFMNMYTFLIGFIQVRLISITRTGSLLTSFYFYLGSFVSFSNFLTAMSFHMAYVQYATTALISLNRFTVLMNNTSIEPAWKKYTWIVMLFIYIMPIFSTKNAFNYETEIIYLNETDSYKYESPMPSSVIFIVLIPFMIITTLFSVGINIASISIVRSMKSQLRQKVESNFLIIMSLTCVVQVMGTILSVAILLTIGLEICKTFAFILPFVSDGLTLIQPWLLIIFSQSIREKITLLFGFKLNRSSSFVPRSNTW